MTFIFSAAEISPETGYPILSDTAGMVALIAANLYVFSFGFSWGPVVWVLLGEMFPNNIFATALSLAAAVNWKICSTIATTAVAVISIIPHK